MSFPAATWLRPMSALIPDLIPQAVLRKWLDRDAQLSLRNCAWWYLKLTPPKLLPSVKRSLPFACSPSHHRCRVSELLSPRLRVVTAAKAGEARGPHHKTTPLPLRSLWVKKGPQQHPP